MRVVFLQSSPMDESLALSEVAAELSARGHEVSLLLEKSERDFRKAIDDRDPDLLVIQAALMAEAWVKRVVELVGPGRSSVLVGTAATFDMELASRTGATWALQGELDDALPQLVDEIDLGTDGNPSSVPGLVWKDDDGGIGSTPWAASPPSLEGRPLPMRDLYFKPYPFMGRFPWKRFATGRGCVHSCGFCYLPGLREGYGGEAPNVRRKTVSRVIDEVASVRGAWPLEQVHFADDLFAPSPSWLEEFADRFPREIGLPFSCNTSPETVTERNAQLLGRAGARVVGIGVETGVEEARMSQLGRPTRNEVIRRAASRLKGQKIKLLTFNMLANPGESLDEALATLRFNQELGTDFPRVNLAYPMPGSYLESALKARGQELPPTDAFSRSEWRAWCADGDGTSFEILQRLFRLSVRHGLPVPLVARVAGCPSRAPFAPLALYDAWVESRWSGIGLLDSLRFARHAGKPNQRVTYHGSLP